MFTKRLPSDITGFHQIQKEHNKASLRLQKEWQRSSRTTLQIYMLRIMSENNVAILNVSHRLQILLLILTEFKRMDLLLFPLISSENLCVKLSNNP